MMTSRCLRRRWTLTGITSFIAMGLHMVGDVQCEGPPLVPGMLTQSYDFMYNDKS